MYIFFGNAYLLSTDTRQSYFLWQVTLFKQSMLVMECTRQPTGDSQHQTMTEIQMLCTTGPMNMVRVVSNTFISSLQAHILLKSCLFPTLTTVYVLGVRLSLAVWSKFLISTCTYCSYFHLRISRTITGHHWPCSHGMDPDFRIFWNSRFVLIDFGPVSS